MRDAATCPQVTKALEKVERENAVLISRASKGDFNPSTTKVVHLSMNPTTAALKKMEESKDERITILERELAALQARLETEDGGDGAEAPGAAAGTGAGALASSDKLQKLELRHQRLKEVFRDKISTFREAVYLLTGFKVRPASCAHPHRSLFLTPFLTRCCARWT